MKFRPSFLLLCTLLTSALCLPARGTEAIVSVRIDGTALATSDVDCRIYQGSTYVPLADFAAAMGAASVWWDGSKAAVSGDGMYLTAAPGALYLSANDRCLYLPQGVKLVEGRTLVPVTALAAAYGLSVRWDEASATVYLTSGSGIPAADYDPDALYWLSRIISAESRGEPLTGQIAVGNVVLNRVASSQFPDSVYGVIFDTAYGIQFEPVASGTIWLEPADSSITAAKLALEGASVVGECLYFYNPALSQSTWFNANRSYYTAIGCHAFYL